MSITKYESQIKTIPYDCDIVYSQLSNLNNLVRVRDFFKNPANKELIASQIPADKARQIKDALDSMMLTADSVKVAVPMAGEIGLRITECEAPKLVKFEAQDAPVAACLWIQLLPSGEHLCKMKVTLGATLNFFIKGIADKYAAVAAERIATVLASLPYGKI